VFSELTRRETVSLLHQALDRGINFYDTAAIYGGGESEELLGEAFGSRRSSVVIATKGGYGFPARRRAVSRMKPLIKRVVRGLGLRRYQVPAALRPVPTQDFSRAALSASLRTSLRRLRTSYVDLYMLHSPSPEALRDGEALEFLAAMKRDGVIRSCGISCESPEDAGRWLQSGEIDTLQIGVSLIEQETVPELQTHGHQPEKGIVARQCFAGGVLAKGAASMPPEVPSAIEDAVAAYEKLAQELGRSLPELAFRFVSDLAAVNTTLIGIRTPGHLRGAVRFAASSPLSPAERQAIASAQARRERQWTAPV
jgi:aryl-alcohol dehydrogenase-like predicted oxidoreductase